VSTSETGYTSAFIVAMVRSQKFNPVRSLERRTIIGVTKWFEICVKEKTHIGADERTSDRLRRLLLKAWRERATTAILVTHNAREAILLADRLLLLVPRPTHVVASIPITIPQENRSSDTVEKTYAELRQSYPESFC
jgi:hypothetical protein